MIEPYVRAFERWVVGDRREKPARSAELRAHLEAADQAGELDRALARLGTPRQAASSFGVGHERPAASLRARALAGLVDYAPYLAASVAINVFNVLRFRHGGHGLSIIFPASIEWNTEYSLIQNILSPLAVAWAILGLALIEVRWGRTPGKALLGLRTISDDGTAVSFGQGVVRRLSILLGPLVFLDVVFALRTPRRQRGFDMLAHTEVVIDVSAVRTERSPAHAGSDR